MSDNDDDIEFDFFEDEGDAATREASAPRVRLPGRDPGRPRRSIGPPRGTAPLLRLLALVALVVFLILVFGLLLQSCASSSKHDSYAHYMDKVTTIATQSTQNGKDLATALTTPGLSVAALDKKLYAIAATEEQNVQAGESLVPPGRLRDEDLHLIDALQLRVAGINDLAKTFADTATAASKSSTSTSTTSSSTTGSTATTTPSTSSLLEQDGQRLQASDVIWDDFFQSPSTDQMKRDGVTGVVAPESHFVQTGEDLSQHGMALVLQRISGAATGGKCVGTHGTDLVSVLAYPNGIGTASVTLSPDTTSLNTITSTTSLAFAVTIHNGGDSQEVHIPITLTIDQPESQGGPIAKTVTLPLIDPGDSATVTIPGIGNVAQLQFAAQTTLHVDVAPVPCEANAKNNSAAYQVIFSLPGG